MVLTALVSLFSLQVLLSDAGSLFSRRFWFDEWVTHLVVSDPHLPRAFAALRTAVYDNAPGLFVILRGIGGAFGTTSEVTLRTFAFLSIIVGLLGIYAALRRAFSPAVALTTVLAVWAHPLVLYHAFEARFYAPWFAAAVWFAFLLARVGDGPRKSWDNALLGVVAVVLCTIHYFGVATMLLIVASELLRRGWAGRSWTLLAPSIVGFLAVAACVPLLKAQRATLTVDTWVPAPSPGAVWHFAHEILLPAHLSSLLAVASVSLMVRAVHNAKSPGSTGLREAYSSFVGLSSLVCFPALLVLFSYVVQPALIPRYAIAAVAGLAPGIALVVHTIPRAFLAVLCVFFLLSSSRSLRHMAIDHEVRTQRTIELADVIRRHTADHPVVFESHLPHDFVHYAPDLAERLYFFGDTSMIRYEDPSAIVWRELGTPIRRTLQKTRCNVVGHPSTAATEVCRGWRRSRRTVSGSEDIPRGIRVAADRKFALRAARTDIARAFFDRISS